MRVARWKTDTVGVISAKEFEAVVDGAPEHATLDEFYAEHARCPLGIVYGRGPLGEAAAAECRSCRASFWIPLAWIFSDGELPHEVDE